MFADSLKRTRFYKEKVTPTTHFSHHKGEEDTWRTDERWACLHSFYVEVSTQKFKQASTIKTEYISTINNVG